MNYIKHGSKIPFTQINNKIFHDKNLNTSEMGILCVLISLPENWKFSEKGLKKILPNDSLYSIRKSLKRLEECGYLTRKQRRGKRGRFAEYDWFIYHEPSDNSDFSPCIDIRISVGRKSDIDIQDNKNVINKKEDIYIAPEKKLKNDELLANKKIPTRDLVETYVKQNKLNINIETFYNYYCLTSWKDSQGKFINWQQKLLMWQQNNFSGEKESQKKEPVKAPYHKPYLQSDKIENKEMINFDGELIRMQMLAVTLKKCSPNEVLKLNKNQLITKFTREEIIQNGIKEIN